MNKHNSKLTILWLLNDSPPFERYLKTCMNVASGGKTVYVCLDKHGKIRAIASSKLTRKPDTPKWTLIRASIWIEANRPNSGVARKVA